MKKTFCDICGGEIPTICGGVTAKAKKNDIELYSYGQPWDICDSCRQELDKFIQAKRAKGNVMDIGSNLGRPFVYSGFTGDTCVKDI